ncbi:MAG: hypothetical protein ACOY3I_03285 [Verrucomicrobiota bacterium]
MLTSHDINSCYSVPLGDSRICLIFSSAEGYDQQFGIARWKNRDERFYIHPNGGGIIFEGADVRPNARVQWPAVVHEKTRLGSTAIIDGQSEIYPGCEIDGHVSNSIVANVILREGHEIRGEGYIAPKNIIDRPLPRFQKVLVGGIGTKTILSGCCCTTPRLRFTQAKEFFHKILSVSNPDHPLQNYRPISDHPWQGISKFYGHFLIRGSLHSLKVSTAEVLLHGDLDFPRSLMLAIDKLREINNPKKKAFSKNRSFGYASLAGALAQFFLGHKISSFLSKEDLEHAPKDAPALVNVVQALYVAETRDIPLPLDGQILLQREAIKATEQSKKNDEAYHALDHFIDLCENNGIDTMDAAEIAKSAIRFLNPPQKHLSQKRQAMRKLNSNTQFLCETLASKGASPEQTTLLLKHTFACLEILSQEISHFSISPPKEFQQKLNHYMASIEKQCASSGKTFTNFLEEHCNYLKIVTTKDEQRRLFFNAFPSLATFLSVKPDPNLTKDKA